MIEGALRPSVALAGRAIPTFQICGLAGFVAALAAAGALGTRLGLSLALLATLAVAAVATFLAVVLVSRAIVGEERLVYYHHELALLAVVALVAAACGRSVLATLDVTAVALGVFLACGRIGCWMVGCCHGRPHRLGLRYRAAHAACGFAPWLVGVPLVPVPAIEAAAVLALTGVAAVRLGWGGAAPGAVLATQLVGYAAMRFLLELARGDAERPCWAGVSEAQWTSVGLALAVAVAERAGWLPAARAHAVVAGALVVALAAAILRRAPRGSPRRLLEPRHVAEVARALAQDAARPASSAVFAHTTSLGVRLSAGAVADHSGGETQVYTLSGIEPPAARALASLILLLRPPPPAVRPDRPRTELVERQGRPGVYHLIVRSIYP